VSVRLLDEKQQPTLGLALLGLDECKSAFVLLSAAAPSFVILFNILINFELLINHWASVMG
jgi:hypothetical protein